MIIILPPEHYHTGKKDREFLENLDKKLHYVMESGAEINISETGHELNIDRYTTQKMTSKEIEKVLELVGKGTGLALTTINTDLGFLVGFQVSYSYGKMPLLKFIGEQLPIGYDFNKLSEVFNKKENIETLITCGLEKPKERWAYEH